jgi:WD40 repeat protein
MAMRNRWQCWFGLMSVLLMGSLFAQSNVSLRGRIVEAQTRQIVRGLCGVEFALNAQTYVCFGVQNLGGSAGGIALYRYASGGSVQRVGFLPLGGSISDVDYAAGASNSEAYLALRSVESGDPLYLLRFDAPTASLTPFGRAALGVSRVQIERLGSGAYLIVVGTTGGRLRVYVWTPGTPATDPTDALTLGTPAVDLPLFPSEVTALRVWSVSGTPYVAAGGSDGMVYLFRWDGTGLVTVGKAMYHPSGVSELVVNGSRLAVGLENGQVYVWNYTSSSVLHHLTLKEPWAPLYAHSLCALPNDQLAVATAFVRVYSLANGAQVGTYGGGIWGNFRILDLWYIPAFPGNLWRLYFYQLQQTVRVLPAVSAGNYFVITAPTQVSAQDIAPRTAFLPSPSSLSYQVTAGTHPVYALAVASGAVASGRANGALQAPWGSRNVNEPVFALESFVSGTTTWLLGSYGAGRVFAWSSGNAFVADVLPAGTPRILYGLRVVSVSSNQVVFATAGGDGKVELWQWTIGSTTPATLLAGRSVGRPLHSLSVNADRSELAVGSWLYGTGGTSAWRLPLTGNTLGAPVALADAVFVAYHPTNPDLLACSTLERLWVYNRATNTNNLMQLWGGIWLSDPLLLAWLPNDRLVGGFLYNGYVGVWWTGADTVTNSRAPDGSTANWIRGGFDRAFEEVYEPHRDRLFALVALPNGDIATGGVDGRVVRWSRAGQPVATTYHLSPLGSVDFSPLTGQQVLASRVMLTESKHALLWRVRGWQDGVLAIRVPAGDPNAPAGLRARVVGWITNDVTDTDVSIRYLVSTDPDPGSPYQQNPYIRYEASEDGAWVMVDWLTYRRQVSSNPPQYVRRARVHLIPNTRLYQLASNTDYYYTEFPDSTTSYAGNHALSPGGVRVAMSDYNQPIRIFDRSGSSWNFSTPSSTINFNVPQYAFLKFLADDVLAVAYLQNNQLQLDVYQLSGGSWTLRQSLATGLRRSWPPYNYHNWKQFIDAVVVGSVVRVAVACDNGLVFYKLTRSGGVVSLTEVGRSTWAANGYLDVGGHHWVRFSRYNPNILGVANGNQAVVYDLTGLFSW